MFNKPVRAQTTMVFILLIIVVFIGTTIFLLSLAEQISQSEYLNMYTHNLLSATLKTDTGLTDSSCRTVSDLLACSFLTPTHVCGSKNCFSLADQEINKHMDRFGTIKEGFRYLLLVEPEGFVSLPQGHPYSVEIGDPTLKDEKTEKITANERIQKIMGGNPYILNIRLIVSTDETA